MLRSIRISEQLIHPSYMQINTASCTEISINHSQKINTEPIQKQQALCFQENKKLSKKPNINQINQGFERKIPWLKPINKLSQPGLCKFKKTNPKNYASQQNSFEPKLHPILIKRSSSVLLSFKNFRSETNKQNHPNQEQKLNQSQQKKLTRNLSSVFCQNSKDKMFNQSRLVKIKSKPHLIFCSSKLPQDFFGDFIVTKKDGNNLKIIGGSSGNLEREKQADAENLKCQSSLKLIENKQKCSTFSCQNTKAFRGQKASYQMEPQFTFRNGKNLKSKDSLELGHIKTPNFDKKQQSCTKLKESLPIPKTNNNLNILEFRKNSYQSNSRLGLKL